MSGVVVLVIVVILLRTGIKRRRRTNTRRDLTQAFRMDTAGLHPRSPRSFLRGSGGGL